MLGDNRVFVVKNTIPEDIYVGFVRSLFNEPAIVLIGGICHGLIALLVYHSSGAPIYLLLAGALFLAGLYRYLGIRRGARANIDTYAIAKKWERSYLFGGIVQAAFMGLFGFVSIYASPNIFGEIAAISAIVGSTVSIVGRNYGSSTMVVLQSLAVVLPIACGLMLKGDIYNFVLGCCIVPFFFVIKRMSDNIRTVLFNAITQEKTSRSLAQRFDRALNTMSHGLVMFDPDGRVVVANAQAAEMLRFSSSRQLMGRTMKGLLLRGVAGGLLTQHDCTYAELHLTRALREGRGRKLLMKLVNNRYLEFSAREGRDDLGVVTFEEVTQRVEAEEKIRFMARYDTLTGLANRAYFHEMVEEFLRGGDPDRLCGLVVFDLDDFKSINDTLGHPVGDGLLYAVAERLSAFAASDVKVSRFGGDEFMAFVDTVADEERFSAFVQEMFASLEGDIDVAGHALRIQLSAGAVISPVRTADVDTMIVKADLALYKAKELGKNGWRLFETAMDEAFRNRQIMKADLRSAIESRNLRVVYQPIVSIASMRIVSCEALCRWDHPELGPVSPAIFIPLAEEMGVVSDISALVLESACKECVKWPEHICVSVNLSANDFRSREVVTRVAGALEQSGLAPHRLEIEVTETALLDDKASTRTYIEELKQVGVRIALDDFGTGYSSLSYLHTLPLDKIKIDGSFLIDVTQNTRSLELLKGVVDLSHRIGLTVTVEGVETFEQFSKLTGEVKPEYVQGFLFGSALTASGIRTMSGKTWAFSTEAEGEIAQR